MEKESVLLNSIKRGDVKGVRKALNGVLGLWAADPNETDGEGFSALMWAGRKGNAEIIRALLEAGGNPNPKYSQSSDLSWTPLMSAAKQGNVEIARDLLRFGADIHAWHHHGKTALAVAAGGGLPGMVKELLGHGAGEPTQGTLRNLEEAAISAREGGCRESLRLLREWRKNRYPSEEKDEEWERLVAEPSAQSEGGARIEEDASIRKEVAGVLCENMDREGLKERLGQRRGGSDEASPREPAGMRIRNRKE